ncbi:MAG: peptidoglycan-binding protein [Alphaproteobacteria bacterium]
MGFKKTSEGRVFFQGSGGNGSSANDGPARPAREQQPPAASNASANAPTQLQILALLRSLNEKLKATQVERNAMRSELDNYRRTMDSLQSRAVQGERAEKLAHETMKELEETRKLLLDLEERQAGVEKESKSNSEKIRVGAGSYRDIAKRLQMSEQKQEEIGRKVEETTTQQAKIMRQIEKAIEDRTRFMRKIERIEETVVQTRDALSAKAMVLLTDQNIAGAVPADMENTFRIPQEPGIPTAIPDEELAPGSWTNARGLQAAAIMLLLVGGILAGWAVSEIRGPQIADSGELQVTETAPAATETEAALEDQADAIVDKWSVSENTAAFSEDTASPATTTGPDPSDDIGIDLTDEVKLQQMLADDPDALAAELNKIEPSDEVAAAEESAAIEPSAGTDTETLAETQTQIASLPPAPAEATKQTPVEIAPAETQTSAPQTAPAAPLYKKSDVDVRSLISPDSNLPESVKKIEDRAFEGMPEAQHDLAAVYTAGHGDVKQNYERALFWFGQAADAGVPNAAYNLGVLHHQGLGTPADLKKAIEWYSRAADLGHPEAQYNLGIAYIEGVGVPYDPFKADAYFEKAAAKGIMEASYNLGLIYENGLLGKPQPDQALVWYKDAADKGSPEAKAALEQLAKTLNIGVNEINEMVEDVRNGEQPVAAPAPSGEKRGDAAPAAPQKDERALLAQIQEHLMGIGLYPGPADGADSPQSQDAIRAYQKINNLNASGRPSAALLVHMLSEDDAGARSEPGQQYN